MNLIDQVEGNIEFISLAFRGEPMHCRDINSMLANTFGKFVNLKLDTNASVLYEERAHAILQSGVKPLVFSADAVEEPLYSQLRVNGSLEKILEFRAFLLNSRNAIFASQDHDPGFRGQSTGRTRP